MVEYDHVAHRFSLVAALADPALSRGAGEQAFGKNPSRLTSAVRTRHGRLRRAAHRRPERGGRSGRPCARRAARRRAGAKPASSAGARRRSGRRRCRAAAPGALGDALHAHRLASGARRTAPTVFSSTSKAPRICSAARRSCSPILSPGSNDFGLPARLAVADTPGTAWALSRFHAAPLTASCRRGTKPRPWRRFPIEALAALAGNPHGAAPARLQIRRRAPRQAARALCRALSPPSFSGVSTRRSAASTSRSSRIVAPPVYHSLRYLLEPIFTQDSDRRVAPAA